MSDRLDAPKDGNIRACSAQSPKKSYLSKSPDEAQSLKEENARLRDELHKLRTVAEITKEKVKSAVANLVAENESLKERVAELEAELEATKVVKKGKKAKKERKEKLTSRDRSMTTSRAFGKRFGAGGGSSRQPRSKEAKKTPTDTLFESMTALGRASSGRPGALGSPRKGKGGDDLEKGISDPPYSLRSASLADVRSAPFRSMSVGGEISRPGGRGPSKLAKMLGETDTVLDQASKKMSEEGGMVQDKDGVLLVKDVTGQTYVRGGDKQALIKLLYSGQALTEFEDNYLLTYRAFTTTETILDVLIRDYLELAGGSTPLTKQKRRRIVEFLARWYDGHPVDFHDLPLEVKKRCREWCSEQVKQADGADLTARALKCFSIVPVRLDPVAETKKLAKPVIPTEPLFEWTILTIDPKEVARQLTLMDFDLFKGIHPKEYIKCAWTKENKEETSPNLLAVIKNFNKLNQWVIYLIVKETDLATRRAVLEHFADIAKALRKLNNFNSLISICSSTESAALFRLRKTKENVNKKKMASFDTICKEVAAEGGYKQYRTVFKSLKPPKIPYMGTFLTDMTNIDEGMISVLEEKKTKGYMNFEKYTKMAGIISQVTSCQSHGFPFVEVREIQSFILRGITVATGCTDDDLFEMSIAAEPREKKGK